jgi:hypothetical protein
MQGAVSRLPTRLIDSLRESTCSGRLSDAWKSENVVASRMAIHVLSVVWTERVDPALHPDEVTITCVVERQLRGL